MVTSPEEYLAEAERYRQAKEAAIEPFSRTHLEAMERSFRTLAEGEAALREGYRRTRRTQAARRIAETTKAPSAFVEHAQVLLPRPQHCAQQRERRRRPSRRRAAWHEVNIGKAGNQFCPH